MSNALVYFRVDGSWRDIEQPIPGSDHSITPQEDDISAYVDFFPGLEKKAGTGGITMLLPDYENLGDTEVALAPITGRMINGKLCSITKGDPTGVKLVANAPWMNLDDPLFYHVRYRNETYGGALQQLPNFAFKAPTDTTSIRLTSPSLLRYEFNGPYQ